ncbi:MAG: hypothetical protein ACKPKO_46815, partial [Candidatus Fonsibacter sp.]
KLVTRLRNPSEILKLHIEHYHVSNSVQNTYCACLTISTNSTEKLLKDANIVPRRSLRCHRVG